MRGIAVATTVASTAAMNSASMRHTSTKPRCGTIAFAPAGLAALATVVTSEIEALSSMAAN
jgi:hypothetical protein